MNLIMYTSKDFLDIKQTYELPPNMQLDKLFEVLFKIKKKKNYFKTDFSIEEQKKNELISYLNKITDTNFKELVKIIYTICINHNLTTFLIEHIFNLAINQSIYCSYYVKIIKYFLENIDNKTFINNFINNKCYEFKNISKTNNIKDNRTLNYEEFCENNKLKIYKKGYSQFLGELFLNQIIEYDLIIENINILFNNLNIIISSADNEFIEDILICIDTLCTTSLRRMQMCDKKNIITHLNTIDVSKISMRLKFKILDLKEKL